MDDYLGAIGLLFFMFFLVAAATEAILETFRGTLERFGVQFLRSQYSLDDAVKMSTEFLPAGSEAQGKVAAISKLVGDVKTRTKAAKREVEKLKESLKALSPGAVDYVEKLNQIAIDTRTLLENNERRRIFVLRLISTSIAIGLCYASDIDAIRLMIQSQPTLWKGIGLYQILVVNGAATAIPANAAVAYLGIIVTGVAAASGSSYWHDQLDKVRNLKGIAGQLSAHAKNT